MHLANSGSLAFIIIMILGGTGLLVTAFILRHKLMSGLLKNDQLNRLTSGYRPGYRLLRLVLLALALLLFGLVLLDPRWGSRDSSMEMDGIDIVFVMDISRSMLTPDVLPNRLDRSKQHAAQLITQLLGNRIALAAFAGYGFKVIPLTTDIQAALNFLEELSTDMIDMQGSNMEDALTHALELFEKDTLTHKAVILISDGEDLGSSPMPQVKKLKENGITLFTIGIGTRAGGVIPLLDQNGEVVGTLQDDKGREVVSHLNEELLSELARMTGGFYLYDGDNNLQQLLDRLDRIKTSPFGTNIYEIMEPQYQFFLLAGLLLLLISIFFPETHPRLRQSGWGIVLLMLLSSCSTNPAQASRLFKSKKYEAAIQIYRELILRDPYNEKLLFNEGNCHLMLTNTDQAVFSFSRITNSPDNLIKYSSKYQLGQAHLMAGEYSKALAQYRQILDRIDPKSPLYSYARDSFIFIKQLQNQKQQQQSQSSQSNQSSEPPPPSEGDQQDKKPQDSAQDNPVQPSDIENLLNLIEQEEKKHLSQKDKPKGNILPPQQKW